MGNSRITCAMVLGLLVGLPVIGRAGSYTFNSIADTSGPYFFYRGFPSINNAATVAFDGVQSGGVNVLLTGSGGSLTPVADPSHFDFGGSTFPSINNMGTVAFLASSPTSGLPGIFTGGGGPITTIVTVSSPNSQFQGLGDLPSINDGGTVAFLGDRRQ